MGILTNLKRGAAATILQQMSKPYGVDDVSYLQTFPGGRFSVLVTPAGHRQIEIRGRMTTGIDWVQVDDVHASVEWADRALKTVVVGKKIPVDANQVSLLAGLWD